MYVISDSEIDELLNPEIWTTMTSPSVDLLGSQDSNQNSSNSVHNFLSSQDSQNVNDSFDSPLEEYFTSKATHNSSSFFWSENLDKFANDSLF